MLAVEKTSKTEEEGPSYVHDDAVLHEACNYYLKYKYTPKRKGIRDVAKKFHVSYYALQRRLANPTEHVKKVGRPRLLQPEEEKELMSFFLEVQKNGISVSKRFAEYQIKAVVARREPHHRVLKRPLSNSFWRGFLARNSKFKYDRSTTADRMLYDTINDNRESKIAVTNVNTFDGQFGYFLAQPMQPYIVEGYQQQPQQPLCLIAPPDIGSKQQ